MHFSVTLFSQCLGMHTCGAGLCEFMYTTHVQKPPKARKRCWVTWDWSYRQLWLLGTELRCSAEQPELLPSDTFIVAAPGMSLI